MSSSDSEGVTTSALSKADKKARKEEKRARKAEKEAKRQRKEEKRRKRARDGDDDEGDESRKDDGDDEKAAKKKRKAEKKARKEAKKEKASASSDVDEQPKAGSSSTQPAPAATKPSTGATTFSSRARQQTPSHNPFAPTTSPAPRGMTPFFPNRPPPPPGVAAAGPSSSTTLDPRDFPPGLDLSAINANLARGASSSSSSSSSAPRRITTAAFEAAITSSSSNKTPRIRAQASKKGESASSGGESLQKSREGTIEDARGLSQAQILAHKLYQPHQLKWLEEAGMLTTLRKGVFTDTEREAMQNAFSSFWKKHKMTFSQGQEVLGSRDHKGQADLYAQMTSAVTESVPGRSQRAVRRYVRETFHPNARKGQWTDKDIMTLTRAYKEVGPNWTAIAQRVGRIARDCRTRWRDHGGEDQRLVGDGTVPGITGETSTGKLSGGESAAGTSSNAGASTSASASATTSASTSTTASWTSAEIKELLIAVPEVCAQLNVDLTTGGSPSWSVVSARIKTKPASSCQRKWDEIRIARLKGKSDEDIIANKRTGREDSYLGARDNKRLVERLEEGGWEDEKEIDWGKVMDEDALVFGKNELSKAWKRLKDRVQGGEKKGKEKGKKSKEGDSGAGSSKAKKPTFKELLAQLKPIVEEEHAKWLQAEEEKQRDGGTKKRKKRGADDSSRSPSGSPSKRPKRSMGTGAVDLGDEIGSDEDW